MTMTLDCVKYLAAIYRLYNVLVENVRQFILSLSFIGRRKRIVVRQYNDNNKTIGVLLCVEYME